MKISPLHFESPNHSLTASFTQLTTSLESRTPLSMSCKSCNLYLINKVSPLVTQTLLNDAKSPLVIIISQCYTILVSTRVIDQRLKRHWVIGPGFEKKLNERWPELCPLADQNPKLWRGRARSWSCTRCPCSHPCTCPHQVLPSFGLTLWLKQGQELRLRSRLNPLSKRISGGIPMLSSMVFIKAHWDWCRESHVTNCFVTHLD